MTKRKARQPDDLWGSVKVKGVRMRVAACWINGELTRMAQHIDPYGGILTCSWEEQQTFNTTNAPTHGEKG